VTRGTLAAAALSGEHKRPILNAPRVVASIGHGASLPFFVGRAQREPDSFSRFLARLSADDWGLDSSSVKSSAKVAGCRLARQCPDIWSMELASRFVRERRR
jgi:hypothetical protein